MHGCIEKHGVNPTLIYCLMTGRPIGQTFEFDELIESLDGEPADIIDDVVLRTLASMRPSIRWNRLRTESLDSLRKTHPVETMCYLLNRLLTPTKEQRLKGSVLDHHRDLIQLYSKLTEDTDSSPESWANVMLALLTIEARAGLLTQEAPITFADLLKLESPIEGIEKRIDIWCAKRIAFIDNAEADAKWFAANPGARRAMMSAFWEVKPKAESTVKKEAKQREANTLGAMLDELLSPGITASKPEAQRPAATPAPKVTARPSTKMPMRFGVKKIEG